MSKKKLVLCVCVVNLMIWVSGLVVPEFFVSQGQAAPASSVQNVTVTNTPSNPVPVIIQGAAGSSARTLVEIVSPNVAVSNLVVYTVPAGQRLVITDVIVGSDWGIGYIYRDTSLISKIQFGVAYTFAHSYQSGIEFLAGQTVGVGSAAGPGLFFELRGYQEAQ